ncbi:hypothetical protein GCM10010129_42070 [Streptomyces fumigatiscleroticus]|nr:hypothetical protein GCM10010129_42070 [Streptomyces fumigatiscleroticus]
MYHERDAYYPPYDEGHYTAGTEQYPETAEMFSEPLVPPGPDWDPVEELAFVLQDAREQQPSFPHEKDVPANPPAAGTPMDNLREITAELPPLRQSPRTHRKIRHKRDISSLRAASLVIAALAAVIASSVSLFSGVVAYEPLRLAAVNRTEHGIVSWWPLLVYGPWLVASLSVLQAALHRRRAVHSWAVVLLFSSIAMLLCILQAPRTLVDTAAAALPGLASLVCFQQVVRQITLSRPPRRPVPRHRLRPAAPRKEPSEEATDTTGKETSMPLPQQRHSAARGGSDGSGATLDGTSAHRGRQSRNRP